MFFDVASIIFNWFKAQSSRHKSLWLKRTCLVEMKYASNNKAFLRFWDNFLLYPHALNYILGFFFVEPVVLCFSAFEIIYFLNGHSISTLASFTQHYTPWQSSFLWSCWLWFKQSSTEIQSSCKIYLHHRCIKHSEHEWKNEVIEAMSRL